MSLEQRLEIARKAAADWSAHVARIQELIRERDSNQEEMRVRAENARKAAEERKKKAEEEVKTLQEERREKAEAAKKRAQEEYVGVKRGPKDKFLFIFYKLLITLKLNLINLI